MPYALASTGPARETVLDAGLSQGWADIGADERGDMTGVRVTLPLVVSVRLGIPADATHHARRADAAARGAEWRR